MTDETTRSNAPAWVAVAVLGAIIALVVITLAYSTINTPFSIDGHKAEHSHWLDSGK